MRSAKTSEAIASCCPSPGSFDPCLTSSIRSNTINLSRGDLETGRADRPQAIGRSSEKKRGAVSPPDREQPRHLLYAQPGGSVPFRFFRLDRPPGASGQPRSSGNHSSNSSIRMTSRDIRHSCKGRSSRDNDKRASSAVYSTPTAPGAGTTQGRSLKKTKPARSSATRASPATSPNASRRRKRCARASSGRGSSTRTRETRCGSWI